jgi:signal transduction histidine kinase/CheY-like chemotaxis protein
MKRYSVLLVEDNPGDARLIREAAREVTNHALAIEHAPTLRAAVDLLGSHHFDAILTDLALPDSMGVETVQSLQRMAPAVPIVVLTGSSAETASEDFLHFGADDILIKGQLSAAAILRAVSHAVERRAATNRAESALRDEARVVETLHRIGNSLAGEFNLERIVQLVTDEATVLTNAAFGAFFYNVLNEAGESFTLYTISGVPREEFSKFPMPRNTKVFDPTFSGSGVVRVDDITRDPRYGKNPPYNGMPAGHLPVRSYLAVPVISRSGEVLGGLFFGHPDPGVFTERSEQIAVGISGWAAVSIDNARLIDAERRARAEAERANAVKSDFLATMSHELRTPLNAMLGYTDLWLIDLPVPLPEQLRPQVHRVQRSAQHLLQLIDEILTFSRIEAGQEDVVLGDTNVHEELETVATLIEPLALEKGLQFDISMPPNQLPITTDARKLRQILINLLSNAVKFTQEGSVRLILEERGGVLRFDVVDTGAGIPETELARIFEPFVQLRSDHRPGGTGLGLSVTRRLARLLGGDVTVTSVPGTGSTFTVTLPLTAPAPAPMDTHAAD